jgi:hypothetical protein
MKLIESASEQQSCYFVDLFVRVSNSLAISMYEHFGYSVYQRVLKYYSGGGVGDHLDEEDAFGSFFFFLSEDFICSFSCFRSTCTRRTSSRFRFFLSSSCLTDYLIDMRKALSLDKDRKSVRENGKEVLVDTPSF